MHKKSISDPDSSSFDEDAAIEAAQERSAVSHLRDMLNTVVKHKSVAVGREHKRDVKGHGIVERLPMPEPTLWLLSFASMMAIGILGLS
jgi:hypothetical protein